MKQEQIFLNNAVRSKDAKFTKLVRVVGEMLDTDQLAKLHSKMEEDDKMVGEPQNKHSKTLIDGFVTKEQEFEQYK